MKNNNRKKTEKLLRELSVSLEQFWVDFPNYEPKQQAIFVDLFKDFAAQFDSKSLKANFNAFAKLLIERGENEEI